LTKVGENQTRFLLNDVKIKSITPMIFVGCWTTLYNCMMIDELTEICSGFAAAAQVEAKER
jgi:hypothetical protein